MEQKVLLLAKAEDFARGVAFAFDGYEGFEPLVVRANELVKELVGAH